MRKLVFALTMALAVLPCFGEVKYRHYVSGNTKVTAYWNTNYTSASIVEDSANLYEELRIENGWKETTLSEFFIEDNVMYGAVLLNADDYEYKVFALFIEGEFHEVLEENSWYGYNIAKNDYDRLCSEYKEYVRKNYHHYK